MKRIIALALSAVMAPSLAACGAKEQAILSSTIIPARQLGREGEIGSIAPGKLADFVICWEDLVKRAVYLGGKALEN